MALSTSLTVSVPSITVAPSPSVNPSVPPASATTGASLTAATVTVLVTPALRLFAPEPSLTCQVIVRLVVDGSSLVLL